MISIGNFDVVQEVVRNSVRIGVLEKVWEHQARTGRLPSQQDIDRFNREVVNEMNQKYPDLGLTQQ